MSPTTPNVDDFLHQTREKISVRLDQMIPELDDLHSDLYSAARYSLHTSGKRLRPILVLATVQCFGSDLQRALDPACALELIHTYSLIHDDLPSMDNDDFRRGKPSLHCVYPEGIAILTGDFLLTYPFEILSYSPALSDKQKIQLIHTLSKRSGGNGMIAGQIVDLNYEGKKIDGTILEFMHFHKTASLFIAAMEFGAILSEASEKDFHLLSEFGKRLGLAFQAINDIQDVTSTKEKLGKPTGSDAKKNKATTVTLLGIEGAKKLAQNLYEEALNTLSFCSIPMDLLIKLSKKFMNL